TGSAGLKGGDSLHFSRPGLRSAAHVRKAAETARCLAGAPCQAQGHGATFLFSCVPITARQYDRHVFARARARSPGGAPLISKEIRCTTIEGVRPESRPRFRTTAGAPGPRTLAGPAARPADSRPVPVHGRPGPRR